MLWQQLALERWLPPASHAVPAALPNLASRSELSQAPRGGACTCTEAASLWRAMAAVVQSAPDTCRQVAVNSGAAARRGRGGSSSWQRLLALPLLAAAVLATF